MMLGKGVAGLTMDDAGEWHVLRLLWGRRSHEFELRVSQPTSDHRMRSSGMRKRASSNSQRISVSRSPNLATGKQSGACSQRNLVMHSAHCEIPSGRKCSTVLPQLGHDRQCC